MYGLVSQSTLPLLCNILTGRWRLAIGHSLEISPYFEFDDLRNSLWYIVYFSQNMFSIHLEVLYRNLTGVLKRLPSRSIFFLGLLFSDSVYYFCDLLLKLMKMLPSSNFYHFHILLRNSLNRLPRTNSNEWLITKKSIVKQICHHWMTA